MGITIGTGLAIIIGVAILLILLLAFEPKPEDKNTPLEIPIPKKETAHSIREEYRTPEEVKQNGILLMILYGDFLKREGRKLHVYLDKQGRILLVDQENKTVSQLSRFYVKEIKYDVYKFHGAKTIYTGATVGGVHTGGFHTESAYMSAHPCHSGNGPLCCAVAGEEYSIKFIIIPDGFFLEQVKDLLKNVGVHNNMMTFVNTTAEVRKTGQHKTLRGLFGPNENVISLVDWEGKASKGHTQMALLATQRGDTYEALEQCSRAKACEFHPLPLNKSIGEVIVHAIACL